MNAKLYVSLVVQSLLLLLVLPSSTVGDCNSNGVADATDIACGTSFDCDSNGIPDECETTSSDIELKTDRFMVKLDNLSRLIDCDYYPIGSSTPVDLNHRNDRTNIANTAPGQTWNHVVDLSAEVLSCNTRRLTYDYGDQVYSQLDITTHDNFLEFSFVSATQDCGRIRMFGPLFHLTQDFNTNAQGQGRTQCLYLGEGKYACMVSADVETRVRIDQGSTYKMIRAISYENVAAAGNTYVRAHRFAFFICDEDELLDTMDEVEDYFGIPGGIDMKRADENHADYLLLSERTDPNDVTAQKVIEVCQKAGLSAVLLSCSAWCDWYYANEPWKLLDSNLATFISDLKNAGLEVGLHAYVHKVPATGYYATNYSSYVATASSAGKKNYDYTAGTTLLEIVAADFADKASTLDATWFYFGAAENLTSTTSSTDDWYLKSLVTKTVLEKLADEGITPTTVQQSSLGANCYHYVSRAGQISYWENYDPTKVGTIYENPIVAMDLIAEQASDRTIVGINNDVGWFGKINLATAPGERYATLEEWALLCGTSLATDATIGIRSSYADWMNTPQLEKVEAALKATTAGRSGLFPDCNSNGVNDDDEISGGTATDVNTNGVPDECEIIFDDIAEASFYSGTNSGIGAISFDFAGTVNPKEMNPAIFVSPTADGPFDTYNESTVLCSSTDDKLTCLFSPALPEDHVYRFDFKDIAIGHPTYDVPAQDCNGNNIVDIIDIFEGTSSDINSNSVPDECEDCNTNGIIDEYDIQEGTSLDCDSNGVPDECDPAASEIELRTNRFMLKLDNKSLLKTCEYYPVTGGEGYVRTPLNLSNTF